MRIILIGRRSFIATAIAAEARNRGLEHLILSHDSGRQTIAPEDCLINCALNPAYRSGAYQEAQDFDLTIARHAAEIGASFTMLSTRRVYSAQARWNAHEDQSAFGDETAYGQNKARSEEAVLALTEGKAGIFRLSNIIGFELGRASFLGRMLTTLREKDEIRFDMDPATQRDFLPVGTAAKALLDRAVERATGVFNLGHGEPTRCGDLAQWVIEGYGRGRLSHDGAPLQDEFFLNMDKWQRTFGPLRQETSLKEYCTQLGRRLKCEKF